MGIKPSGSLKQFLDTKKAETRLTGPIERHLLTRPLDTSRRQDVIHPSELVKNDFCVRASYFRIIGVTQNEDRPGLRLQSIFDEGHSIHHKWQEWIREGGWMYGVWECNDCGNRFWDTSPEACSVCGDPQVSYKEVPLTDPDLMIAGHSDGWVKGLKEDFMIEIKSVGSGTMRLEQPSLFKGGNDLFSAWRDVRRPFPTHIRQGQLYLELARRMAERGILESAPSEIVFLYELKADQSYKEFVVKADPFIVKDMLDNAFDIARAVRAKTPLACNISPDGCKSCKGIEVPE